MWKVKTSNQPQVDGDRELVGAAGGAQSAGWRLDTPPLTFLCPLFQQILNFLYWLYWWTLDVPSTRQTQFVYSSDFLLEKSCLFYLAEVSISATFLYLKTNRYLSLCWWLMLKFFLNPWLKYTCDIINMCFIISKVCLTKYLQQLGDTRYPASQQSSPWWWSVVSFLSPEISPILRNKELGAFILYRLIDRLVSEICWQVKL